MSKIRGLYQRSGAAEWLYDIQIRGNRFCGSTGTANRREAERWLVAFRAKKKAEVAEFSGAAPMTFGVASTRWWEERGQHRKDSRDIERFLGWLQAQIGNKTALAAIDNNTVARLVATRRAEDVSPATVNRSVTEPLRAILARAGDFWGQNVQKINWGGHKLAEPQQRVREASAAEEAKLFAALRPDFHPIARFMLITGMRRAEACGLRWADIDMDGCRITVHGKGDRVDKLPLTSAAMGILRGEQGRSTEFVFTYQVRHKWGGKLGSRVPIAPDTLGTAFWRARRAAGLADADLRLHDIRHTAATRLLRATGNLGAAQKMLRHTRITTTMRYAHVTDDDLRAAMETAAPVASIVETPGAGDATSTAKPAKKNAG